MKLGLDRKTGLYHFLTSWKSHDDSGCPSYSCTRAQPGYGEPDGPQWVAPVILAQGPNPVMENRATDR
ncbi:hypothetical protein CsSME_00049713 [Camellia sinensis var. sinensis]